MKKFVPDYDRQAAPAILVPAAGHTAKHLSGRKRLSTSKVNIKTGKPFVNARELIARDIRELRRVFPDIPKAKLKNLIEMNKIMYPKAMEKTTK